MTKKTEKDGLVAINVKIPKSTREKLEGKAAKAFRNLTQEVRLALENHVK